MSDTPRTDEVEMHYRQVMEDRDAPMYLVPAAFAQGLEREVAALRDALLRCVREIQPHHIPGDVYTQAQRALGMNESSAGHSGSEQ